MNETSTSGPDADHGPRVNADQLRDMRRLRRPHERKIAGVAAGLARHLDVDPLVLRIAFVVLVFFGGSGLVLYGALWLLLPEDGAASAPVPLDEKSRGIAVIGVGILAALLLLGDTWDLYWFPWPLALIALAVWWFVFRKDQQIAPDDQPSQPSQPGRPGHPQVYAPNYSPQYSPGPLPPRPPATRPRDPRRQGPVLFWFTCALIALLIGVLGILDLAGVLVPGSAYPALVLAVTGTMLLVGAFYGRAGGLILIGVLAGTVLAGSLLVENLPDESIQISPSRAAQVQNTYELSAGEFILDLRGVEDLENLDARDISISGGVGRIQVLLPPELAAFVSAEVGPGQVTLFDSVDRSGLATSATASSARLVDPTGPEPKPSANAQPEINLDVDLGVGEILVTNW